MQTSRCARHAGKSVSPRWCAASFTAQTPSGAPLTGGILPSLAIPERRPDLRGRAGGGGGRAHVGVKEASRNTARLREHSQAPPASPRKRHRPPQFSKGRGPRLRKPCTEEAARLGWGKGGERVWRQRCESHAPGAAAAAAAVPGGALETREHAEAGGRRRPSCCSPWGDTQCMDHLMHPGKTEVPVLEPPPPPQTRHGRDGRPPGRGRRQLAYWA